MVSGDLTATTGNASDYDCVLFDGVNDKIIISGFSDDFIERDFSITGYFNCLNPGTNTGIIEFNTGSVSSMILKNPNSTTVRADIISQAGATSSTGTITISKNTWYKFAITKNSSNLDMYIDNVAATTVSISATTDWRISPKIEMGHNLSSNVYGKVLLRAIRLYGKKLSVSEIQNDYDGKKIEDSLLNEWELKTDAKDTQGSKDGTVTGAIFLGVTANEVKADIDQLNLTTTTDKLIVVPTSRRDQGFKVFGVNRAA